MGEAKPFGMAKRLVWEAWLRVKANQGAAGVDGESMARFEKRLRRNLYRIWNRLSSGTYFPPPVRSVKIPKPDGRERTLGIPTVGDRVAQMVVKQYLEPSVEPAFHADSYGYRPGKSAADAVGQARSRCWRYDWVVDLDIKAFFDAIDHALMMRAVRKHTDCPWVLLYIERWLTAPAQAADGTTTDRDRGTPQGGVISPLLANLFLHYSFDRWMAEHHADAPFERYADDIVIHCRTEARAVAIRRAVEERFAACRLAVHPEKTKIVYCRDGNRTSDYPRIDFDFLGFTFRPRKAVNRRGKFFLSFLPGGEPESRQGNRVQGTAMANPHDERQKHRRSVAHVRPDRSGLGQLLRTVLQVRPVSHLRPPEPQAGAMGAEEVPAIPPPAVCDALVAGLGPSAAGAVRTLATGGGAVTR
jgi:RNA-directed DNA polymerase